MDIACSNGTLLAGVGPHDGWIVRSIEADWQQGYTLKLTHPGSTYSRNFAWSADAQYVAIWNQFAGITVYACSTGQSLWACTAYDLGAAKERRAYGQHSASIMIMIRKRPLLSCAHGPFKIRVSHEVCTHICTDGFPPEEFWIHNESNLQWQQ